MTGLRERPGDQALPVRNAEPGIQRQVIADIEARIQIGVERYGTELQPHNQRDALRDLYEELTDATVYARQVLAERDDLWHSDKIRAQVASALARSSSDGQTDAVMSVVRELMTAIAAAELDRRDGRQMEIASLREHLAVAHAEIDRRRGVTAQERERLGDLMVRNATVKITIPGGDPDDPKFIGWIRGIADHPACLVDCADGKRRALPQTFDYQEITE